jgi:hypothetical protein
VIKFNYQIPKGENKMKKTLAIILAILMIVTTIPMVALPASAALTPTAKGGCNGDHSGYTLLERNLEITEPGNYYINSNWYSTTYGSTLEIECSGTVTVCLNGYDLYHTGEGSRVVYILGNGDELTVNLCDCKGTGEIYHKKNDTGIDVLSSTTVLNMYGGTIRDCNRGIGTTKNATINMYGGTIKNCSYYGIFQNDLNCKVNIYGGSIINNTEGIRVCSADSVILTGSPVISGNTNGDLYFRVRKSPVIAKDLSVSSPITIGQDSKASGDYAVVKVDSADMLGSFKYIDNTKKLVYSDGQIFVHGDSHSFKDATCAAPKTCTICGATEGSADANAHDWSNLDGICVNGCGAVCDHAGQTGEACAICGATLHTCDFTGAWKFDGKHHWKECDCGNVAQKATHPYGPTCTCGYVCPHAKTYTLITRPVQNADGTWGKGELEVHCNNCGSTVSTQELERDHEGYALLEETLAKLEAAISGDKVTASATAMFTGKISGVRGGAYGLVYTQIDTKIAECIETAKGYIEEFEAGFADGTYRKADWTAMTAVLEEVGALIDNDPEKLIPSVKGDYTSAKSYYNACVNNVNYSQANYDSNEELYDYENKLAALIAGINDGTALKADYTAIDEKIAEIDEMIADITLMDVYQTGLEEIKADLEEMKADENTSAADLEELEATLNEYDAAIEAGIADGTAVKVDGFTVYNERGREWLLKFADEGVFEKARELILNSTEVQAKLDEIYDFALSLEGNVAENAENIAKIEADVDEFFGQLKKCVYGIHNVSQYKEISPAKCGENAIESAVCTLCGETVTREVENSALKHSFTKYEVTEEAKCDVAGKKVATCDYGCGATDEKAIEALTHTDADGDYICDNGCGYEFEKPAPEEPTDDDEICTDCGGPAHEETGIPQYICWLITLIKIIMVFFK